MKYSQRKFTVALGSDAYRENFDRIFGKKALVCTFAEWDERHLRNCQVHDVSDTLIVPDSP